MIEGVIITPLRRIPDERGMVMHMMTQSSTNKGREKHMETMSSRIPGQPGQWIIALP